MLSKLRKSFDIFVSSVLGLIVAMMAVGIAIGAVQLVWSIAKLLQSEGITGNYIGLIADVLTLYVLIELSKSLIDYIDVHRLRLTPIADAAIVFVVRELLIGIFKHSLDAQMLYAYAVVLLVLVGTRTSAMLMNERENRS